MRLFIMIGLILFNVKAYGCSCAIMEADSIMANSDVVFIGAPLENSTLTGVVDPEFPSQRENRTPFYVTKSYKNLTVDTIDLYSSMPDGANCGIEFINDNGVYVVAGYQDPNSKKYYTSVCDIGHLGDQAILDLVLELEKISKN